MHACRSTLEDPTDGPAFEPPFAAPAPEPAPDAAAEAWRELLGVASELHRPGALDHAVELRHVRRRVQPLVDALLTGERVAEALAHAEPGESTAAHAAHTALAAVCLARALGLGRASIADLGVAALLLEAGRGTAPCASGDLARPSVQALLRCATWSPLSLCVMQAALFHPAERSAPLVAQVVSAADAYVSLLTRQGGGEPWASPAGCLARVLGTRRDRWHPAIPGSLVRALGLFPPGQIVQLDDGSFVRALAPDPRDPARPWIARLVDARGLPVPAWARTATRLPARRHVVRALPRQEWSEVDQERPAA